MTNDIITPFTRHDAANPVLRLSGEAGFCNYVFDVVGEYSFDHPHVLIARFELLQNSVNQPASLHCSMGCLTFKKAEDAIKALKAVLIRVHDYDLSVSNGCICSQTRKEASLVSRLSNNVLFEQYRGWDEMVHNENGSKCPF